MAHSTMSRASWNTWRVLLIRRSGTFHSRAAISGEKLSCPQGETSCDFEHGPNAEGFAVGLACAPGESFEGEGLFVLICEGELGAEEQDDPAEVDPHEQDGNLGKSRVEDAVAYQAKLERDVEPVEDVPEGSADDAAEEGATEPDMRVGHEVVHGREAQPYRQVLGRSEDDGRADGQIHVAQDGGEADHAGDEDGQDQHDHDVVADHAVQGACVAKAPDLVEGGLDVAHEAEKPWR